MKKAFLLLFICLVMAACILNSHAALQQNDVAQNYRLEESILSQASSHLKALFSQSMLKLSFKKNEEKINQNILHQDKILKYPFKNKKAQDLRSSATVTGNTQKKIISLDDLDQLDSKLKDKLLDQAKNPQNYLSQKSSALSASSQNDENQESKSLDSFAYKVVEFNPGFNEDNELIMQPLNWPYIYAAVSGPPDFSLYENNKQKEKILSLGHGGSIVIKIVKGYIYDGVGDDFKIFENPFVSSDGQVYAETAIVSVAQENKPEKYVYFNCNNNTVPFKGCAGTHPVFFQQGQSLNDVGGDGFDLSEVSMDKIRYIKIEDTGDNVSFFLGDEGFDLDALGIIYGEQD